MRKVMMILTVLNFMFMGVIAQTGQHGGWYLIWNDEFDGQVLNPQKWNIEEGPSYKESGDLSCYSADNAYVANGMLVLEMQKKQSPGWEYTCGRINTKGHFSLKYGKLEARIKMTPGNGLYTSFWMMDALGNWPPEIDIIELRGKFPTTTVQNFHWLDSTDNHKDNGKFLEQASDITSFQIYSVEWEPGQIRYYINGKLTHVVQNKYCVDRNMYIILQSMVSNSPDWIGIPDSSTNFPAHSYIDYVRVYKMHL